MKTLITEHWAAQGRGSWGNHATRVTPHAQLRFAGQDLRTLFLLAYPTFAERCRAVDQPGVAIVAVDEVTGEPIGMACVRAQVDRHVAVIVGRHDRCDLALGRHERLALRQLAVVLGPVTDWRAGASAVSFRILDLRTSAGMHDESGRSLRGLRSEGPAMIRCAGYALFALPLGDPSDWPANATDAWAQLPERVYHDELVAVPDASRVQPPPLVDRGFITLVTRISGPRGLDAPLVAGRELAGRLTLRGPAGTCTLDVGASALRDGVLLGRYERCDATGIPFDNSVSRVHALLLHVNDRLIAIDVASTNGTRCMGAPDARVIELGPNTMLELGETTVVSWRWAS